MIPLYFAYFVFGFTFAFISVAVQFHMVEHLHFSPANNTYSWAIISSPWIFKPVYGILSDKLHFGYRRAHVSIAAFLCGLVFAYAPSLIVGQYSLVAVLTTGSLFLCVADVVCDALMVAFAKANHNGGLQSRCWMARNFGALSATSMSGVAYTVLGFSPILRLAALPIFIMSVYIWDLKEERSATPVAVVAVSFKAFASLWRLLLFIGVCALVPEISAILFYKLRDSGINPLQLSLIKLTGSGCACVAAFGYQFWRGYRSTLIVSLNFGVISTVIAFAIAQGANAFEWAVVRSVLNSFASMLFVLPIAVRTTTACPDGAEGTTYSMVMAWMNLSGIVSETLEGAVVNALGITQYDLSKLGIFCFAGILLSCVPFSALRLLTPKTENRVA